MLIKKTGDMSAEPVKMAIYAPSGTGKTTQIALMQKYGFNPIALSLESGMLSLEKCKELGIDVPYIDVTKDDAGNLLKRGSPRLDRIGEIYQYLQAPEVKAQYNLIVFDTLTELADSIITSAIENEKAKDKPDLRQAYGALATQLMAMIHAFRDMNHYSVIFLLQESLDKDELSGKRYFGPDLPGKASQRPFQATLDSLFRMFVGEDGKRYFQTGPTPNVVAKHRGARLELIEPADFETGGIGRILRQMKGLPLL